MDLNSWEGNKPLQLLKGGYALQIGGMFKNQLQELAQRSCFNLPSYSCIREGPDHAPRFKATVNFNGETFESPTFCYTLRQAEHVAAEVALNALARRGPSRALAARVLDETGVYKNLLQETAHRAGLNLPAYTTVKSGPGHIPAYSCTVELAGISFYGEPARTKKQAQKNAAMAAWSSLKRLAHRDSSSSSSMDIKGNEEQEQVIIARILKSLHPSQAKNSTQNECRQGQQRCIPITNRSSQTAASLYPTQFPSWVYPSYSPELAMYQLWQQQELLQQRNCLLALPVLPSIPSIPQMFPFMHSVLRPNHCLYFPGMQQESTSARPRISIGNSGPSIYVSDHMVPNLNRCRSTVTIQEIKENKQEESSESTSTTTDPFVIGKNDTELRIQESVPEDEKQSIGEEGRKIVNIKSEGDRIEQLELNQSRIMDSCHPIDFRLQNLGTSSTSPRQRYPPPKVSSQRSLSPQIPASPLMIRNVRPASSMGQNVSIRGPASTNIRTGTPSCSARTMPRITEFGGARNSFMAPAVRIRSVVPVCSAPPPRKLSGSSQERGLPNIEKDKNKDDASKANSDLSKLHI